MKVLQWAEWRWTTQSSVSLGEKTAILQARNVGKGLHAVPDPGAGRMRQATS